jgi:CheY-like chemotaxis protein
MKTILIAEDNAVNRELLRELLEARGYAVEEACNGLEALQMIAQSKPDALLLDLNMPVLDGFATVRKIRKDPAMASLPVLAVTAYAMRGDREKTLEADLMSTCRNLSVPQYWMRNWNAFGASERPRAQIRSRSLRRQARKHSSNT